MQFKKFIPFVFFISSSLIAQQKPCVLDIEEKTDSTSLKKTKDYLIYEKDFVNTHEHLSFALVKQNGTPYLQVQLLQKSSEFIPNKCIDANSKSFIQLNNGKFFTLLAVDDVCSQLLYDEQAKQNIRILTAYYLFTKENYELLRKEKFSLLRINFTGEASDYVIKKELTSNLFQNTYYPENFFKEQLSCIE